MRRQCIVKARLQRRAESIGCPFFDSQNDF
jgi:hypothetical protein